MVIDITKLHILIPLLVFLILLKVPFVWQREQFYVHFVAKWSVEYDEIVCADTPR